MTAARRRRPPSEAPLPHAKPLRKDRLAAALSAREVELLARGQLRHEVLERAKFRCESCGADLRKAGCVFDHWLGGSGRRREQESLETTWALCLGCNDRRTINVPSAAHWNDTFAKHCRKHGYPFVPHITKFEALAIAASKQANGGGA